MMRVLLAEDDETISEPLSRALRREGYSVDVAEDGRAALTSTEGEAPDLVILDIGLPYLDGLEVCRRIRQEGLTSPVLILTARGDEVDTVVGLDAGADDYVTKPFRLAELLARVRALLRRGNDQRDGGDRPITIDTKARQAFFRGQEVALTAKEFDLLRVLAREEGRVVPRETLMLEVWDSWFGSTKTLDMHISVLRRKLGDDANNPRYIVTVRGVGFRFQNEPEQ
ncbi:MAG TPA: response regulator transcription factor [Ornithinimicrobium sp.]|uniref:response regulator transcription factor n=1 Tax=Ornithinimicrobium sp. TaxID=1977084 RepID=UPI002B465B40|nr:response regulator transcription factor [Ornithinimicrobium sp.]HKJ12623.1 response regulator transcription factor [Ornithinimicrobium sp.]